ncbi:hypothetical protein BZA77DRAFT_67976 [Pyronema omphalodes]|nr:hypothetical protein BZA77DRAFT_67976 [Pyronema omphalodes]
MRLPFPRPSTVVGQASRKLKVIPYLLILVFLLASIIINAIIVNGCKLPSPVMRGFYLISITYNPDSQLTKLNESLNSAKSSVKDKAKDISNSITSKVTGKPSGDNTTDDNQDQLLASVRVGYSALCIQTRAIKDKDLTWTCGKSVNPDQKYKGDIMQLSKVGRLIEKMSWSAILWVVLGLLVIGWVMSLLGLVNSIMPLMFKFTEKAMFQNINFYCIAAGTLGWLGAMLLQHAMGSMVQKVIELVGNLGDDAVIVKRGNQMIVFGWIQLGLLCAATALMCWVWFMGFGERKTVDAEQAVMDKAMGARDEMWEKAGRNLPGNLHTVDPAKLKDGKTMVGGLVRAGGAFLSGGRK